MPSANDMESDVDISFLRLFSRLRGPVEHPFSTLVTEEYAGDHHVHNVSLEAQPI